MFFIFISPFSSHELSYWRDFSDTVPVEERLMIFDLERLLLGINLLEAFAENCPIEKILRRFDL